MARTKGPKKPKTEFMVLRKLRKKTRHTKNAPPPEAAAKKEAGPVKA